VKSDRVRGDGVRGDLVRSENCKEPPNHRSANHYITLFIIRSPNHQITKSQHHNITTSQHHQITTSQHHQITTSLMRQEDFNEVFRNRSKAVALEVIRLTASLPYNDACFIIKKQLIRSITWVAANFRAVCRGRSDKEKFAKLCMVVEEADESLFWIEMLEESNFIAMDKTASVKRKQKKF